MRALSITELRTRLIRRAAEAGDIDGVLAKLKEYGYLDDKRFAETFAIARRDNQGFGKMRVMRDLQQRKVAKPVAEKAIAQTFAGVDETAQIEQFLQRKFRGKNLPEYLKEEKHLASAYRRLRYAGFSSGTSIRVLKRYSQSADQLESLESDPADPEQEA